MAKLIGPVHICAAIEGCFYHLEIFLCNYLAQKIKVMALVVIAVPQIFSARKRCPSLYRRSVNDHQSWASSTISEIPIQTQPLFDTQFRGRDVQRKVQVAGKVFPLLVGKDVFKCQFEIRFPAPETVLDKFAIEANVLCFY